MRKIGFKERNINIELIKKYFFVNNLGDVLKNFKKSKNNLKRSKTQVDLIRLKDLKKEIQNMTEEEKKLKLQMKQQILLKIFLSLIDNNKDKA